MAEAPWRIWLDELAPPRCSACRKTAPASPPWRGLCVTCAEGLSPCSGVEDLGVGDLAGVRAVARYEEPLAGWLWQFKYGGERRWAGAFAAWLAVAATQSFAPSCLAAVPPDPVRLSRRRFDPPAEMLVRVARTLRWPSLPGSGWVRAAAPAQAGLGARRRRLQLRGLMSWQGRPLQGRAVVLLDDVCTTGGTLQASALALRQGGAGPVWGLVLCRQALAKARPAAA
jgi:predicted amidophosphoribosyltransferase